MSIKTEGRVKVRSTRPIMRYHGYDVLVSARHFSGFAGANSFRKIIVVSPRFLKLSRELQQKVLSHEYEECRYFDQKLGDLGQEAHRYAYYKTGFPNDAFAIQIGRKKPDWWYKEIIPW